MNESTQNIDSPGIRQVPVSVLILTRNEQRNIAGCLENVAFSDDIVVLDSCSTDETVEIARRYPTVRVFTRPFDTEWKQRNHGLREIAYKYPWLYICDADERLPADLIEEIRSVVNSDTPCAAYRLRFRNHLMGRWIKHSSGYPVWIIRLVRPERVAYEQRETNVHPVVDGCVEELKCHFEHYSFNNGLVAWFSKHNFYSTREAIEGVRIRNEGWPGLKAMRQADPMQRRRALKNASYFLVWRGCFRFIHSYFIRGGLLDGIAGLHYCRMIAMYERWIELKMKEKESNWADGTLALAEKLLSEDNRGK